MHGHTTGGDEAAGGDAESERSPAATKASGLADGQGKAPAASQSPTNGAAKAASKGGAHANGSTTPSSHGALAAGTPKPAAKASSAASNKRLEQAGVMVLEPGTSLGDRQSQFAKFQIDAPVCDGCGAITVRNGNCYLCHNCGNSMGCS
jgi:ribonucleoside-diphosphate reductase alpha chain